MLSIVHRDAPAVAGSRPKPALTDRYDFIPADVSHKAEIVEFALEHFLSAEPHCLAFGITRANGYSFIESIVSKCLKYKYSLRIVEKVTGKLIGIRLMTVITRGEAYDNGHTADTHESELMMAAISDKMKSDLWRVRPHAKKVLLREMTCIHRDNQRQGIAQFLVHYGFDLDRLRASGIDGIMSEASSLAHQKLLLNKFGYRELSRSNSSHYIRSDGSHAVMTDGTTSMKALYYSLHNESHL